MVEPQTSGDRSTALVLEHDRYSMPGSFADRAREVSVDFMELRVDGGGEIPDPRDFGAVIVLGSAWSVFEEIQPWFRRELAALRVAMDAHVPVLGVCFGAQTLSVALGGEVHRVQGTEIGWTQIDTQSPDMIDSGPWFQWHHDVLSLPAGAELLAWNAFGTQAFLHGKNLGVQFHPEITADVLRSWLDTDPSEAIATGLDPDALLAQTEKMTAERRQAAYRLLDRFLAESGLRARL